MAIGKQIKTVGFHNSNFTNGNGTPTDWSGAYGAGTLYEIDVQNYNLSITPEFYTDNSFDKALSGKLRQNLRGYRLNIELNYEGNTQSRIMRDLFNDIIVAFVTNNEESIRFHPDDNTKSNNFDVVLDDSQYNNIYESTVARFIPSISLVTLDELTTIPTSLEL